MRVEKEAAGLPHAKHGTQEGWERGPGCSLTPTAFPFTLFLPFKAACGIVLIRVYLDVHMLSMCYLVCLPRPNTPR